MRRSSMLMIGGADITASQTALNDASGTKVLSFSTAAPGDLGIIHTMWILAGGNTATASGWNRSTYTWTGGSGYGYISVFMWKVLTGADISSGVTVTGLSTNPNQQGIGWAAYSGANSAAVVGDAIAKATSVSVPGFTKDGRCVGVVSILHEVDNVVAPVPPAGMTRRQVQALAGGSYGSMALADLLSPDEYTSGALAWTGLSAMFDQVSVVIELRE